VIASSCACSKKQTNRRAHYRRSLSFGYFARIPEDVGVTDGNTTIIIQGRTGLRVEQFVQENHISLRGRAADRIENQSRGNEMEAWSVRSRMQLQKILSSSDIPQEAQVALDNISSTPFLIHFLASNLNVDVSDKQRSSTRQTLPIVVLVLLQHMSERDPVLEIKHEIQKKVHTDIDQQQRDYFLRQSIKCCKMSWATMV